MSSSLACGVRVICRFRPKNQKERKELESAEEQFSIDFYENKTVEMNIYHQRDSFTFDRVFDEHSTQQEVFEISSRMTIQDVLDGYNGTIFAYGQTGAGKTHTMLGNIIDDQQHGIIPRVNRFMFNSIMEGDSGTKFCIKCSYLEIYNETINDLLDGKNRNLNIRESPQAGVFIPGLTEETVCSEADVLDLLHIGDRNRAVAATKMNERSSRSHSLFQIIVYQTLVDGSCLSGKLNLVDLAGSEKVGKTGATGQTLNEAKKINQSLSALGKCIYALSDPKKKASHIPYRDSKLTRILQESLGGNTKTTLLICCSPALSNHDETLSTLKFGARAKTIETSVKSNNQRNPNELKALISRLRKELDDTKASESVLKEQLNAITSNFKFKDDGVGSDLPDEIGLGLGSSTPVRRHVSPPSSPAISQISQASPRATPKRTTTPSTPIPPQIETPLSEPELAIRIEKLENLVLELRETLEERTKRMEELHKENSELEDANKLLREEIRLLRGTHSHDAPSAPSSEPVTPAESPRSRTRAQIATNTIVRGSRRGSVLADFRESMLNANTSEGESEAERLAESDAEGKDEQAEGKQGDVTGTPAAEPAEGEPKPKDGAGAEVSKHEDAAEALSPAVIEAEVATKGEPISAGWLRKPGSNILKSMHKKHYWVLYRETLTCYDDASMELEKANIPLREFILDAPERGKAPFRFALLWGDKVHELEADSRDEYQQWVTNLKDAITGQIAAHPLVRRDHLEIGIHSASKHIIPGVDSQLTVDQAWRDIASSLGLDARKELFEIVEVIKRPDSTLQMSQLDHNERLCAVLDRWEDVSRRMGYNVETVAARFKLAFKKVVFHQDDEETQPSSEVDLEFTQALDAVISGRLNVETDAFVLAACQLQADIALLTPDSSDNQDTLLANDIEKYLPAEYFKGQVSGSAKMAKKEAKWARDIKAIRADLQEQGVVTASDAKRRYLHTARQWPLYGMRCFLVDNVHWESSANSGLPATKIILGVSRNGVTLLKYKIGKFPRMKDVLLTYTIEEIHQWGSNDRILKLVTCAPPDLGSSKSGKYYGPFFFSTDQGNKICDMIKAYALKAISLLEDALKNAGAGSV
eukprot:TRINITY_DN562_c0_g1::TRINITY_DN562_c0_g1_i1::g.10428::m.10428 TRINITY_DN562_c0_g1::TRINITY_DN562_c0_g1_i1::g.10428  ORF type:complete len:1103 (+),score=308.19,sp/Q8T135/KIF5_DICDI/51.99/1e-111,Kinesin/PF00225.18/2e-112,FERM_M/PF00373.13/3.3e+03,FERM_M/PF00373.13/2.3e-11,PH/PF00169.24/1.5e-08,ALIX_LYPXL_bnd/PF13949.1/0.00024,ALIX_LYPXL_bnd/PF13949.1/2.8e+02,DUF2205/PF10224.4/0.00036,IncA/PF04156.9/5.4e+02,IncA/PF04156.9/1.1e+02,IncA/PF04156.9/0.0025,PH_8/PF15409.1/0.044,DUF972/PF06156.8/1e+03,DU